MLNTVKPTMPTWPEVNEKGQPYAKSQANVAAFLAHIDCELYYDAFASRALIRRDGVVAEIDDNAILRLFFDADTFGLRPPKAWLQDCILNLANSDPRNGSRGKIEGAPRCVTQSTP